MARAKVGTRMSHITVVSAEVDSTWVSSNYNGLLITREKNTLDLETEDLLDMTTEALVQLETDSLYTDIEITSIGFVEDETESSNSTTGQFQP
jgi:hypothetical protein